MANGTTVLEYSEKDTNPCPIFLCTQITAYHTTMHVTRIRGIIFVDTARTRRVSPVHVSRAAPRIVHG